MFTFSHRPTGQPDAQEPTTRDASSGSAGRDAAACRADATRSGPLCGQIWPCVPAPYVDVGQFIPGDYLWLVPGILLAPIFVVLLASIHACAPEPQKIFSRIGLAFAVAYGVVIGVDYFLQFAVVIPSLQSGETQGLSLFTQYNPHGLFIAGKAAPAT